MIAVITAASSSGWAAVTANSMVRVPRSVMACALGGAHRRVSSQGVCGRGGHRGRVDRDGADVPGLVQPYRGGLAHRPVCHQPAQCQSDAQQADAGDGHRHHHVSIASTRPGTVTDCGSPVNRPACQISAPTPTTTRTTPTMRATTRSSAAAVRVLL